MRLWKGEGEKKAKEGREGAAHLSGSRSGLLLNILSSGLSRLSLSSGRHTRKQG